MHRVHANTHGSGQGLKGFGGNVNIGQSPVRATKDFIRAVRSSKSHVPSLLELIGKVLNNFIPTNSTPDPGRKSCSGRRRNGGTNVNLPSPLNERHHIKPCKVFFHIRGTHKQRTVPCAKRWDRVGERRDHARSAVGDVAVEVQGGGRLCHVLDGLKEKLLWVFDLAHELAKLRGLVDHWLSWLE